MNIYLIYIIIAVLLLGAELAYFAIADRCNIIDKPNERSSHSKVVLRGGGIIFTVGIWIWSAFFGFQYPWMLAGVTLVAGVSFIDDIHSLPDSLRLVAQFTGMVLLFYQVGLMQWELWWLLALAFIICVGLTNIYNFMDGVNGITGGYSIAVIVPLMLVSCSKSQVSSVEPSFLVVVLLSLLAFCLFNFRPKNRAKCFAGDVGSIGIALILMFCIGKLVMVDLDVTWFVLLIVYGIDGTLTIVHRIMLHENLGKAHRKHAYQLMANELKMGHVAVSCIYMALQLVVSLGFIYGCPVIAALLQDSGLWDQNSSLQVAHWAYLIGIILVLALMYLLFMRRYYFLHEGYIKMKNMSTEELIKTLRNAATNGDAKEIIALTNLIDQKDLATNPELEEAYRIALAQIME